MRIFHPHSPTVPCIPCQMASARRCAAERAVEQKLGSNVAARVAALTGHALNYGKPSPFDYGPQLTPGNWTGCQRAAVAIRPIARRLMLYTEALPFALAASDLNRLSDHPDDGKSPQCLTMLSEDPAELAAQLGLDPRALGPTDLRDDRVGFRAAVYRSERTGGYILVARDTQRHSLVDWQTNTESGQGRETDQYRKMQLLAQKLATRGVRFDIAGYSKGGGMAQEAALYSPDSRAVVFNSAGLSQASLERAATSTRSSLQARTTAFSSEGDFLTYMNTATDGQRQLDNAEFLSRELAKGGLGPIGITYSNPAVKKLKDKQLPWEPNPDPSLKKEKQKYIESLRQMIRDAEADQKAGKELHLFPPVRAGTHETIPNSMSWRGQLLRADADEANYGRLYQHTMEHVVPPMKDRIREDSKLVKAFLQSCS